MLDFQKFQILTAGTLQKVTVRHYAKCSVDWYNRCADMAVFFQDGGRPLFGDLKV